MFVFPEWLPSLFLALVAIGGHVQAQGYYTITSPGNIRPNSKYSVHVSVSDVSRNTKIKLTLKGPEYINFTELDIPPNSERSVTFDLGEITKGAYSLEASGLSGIIFENATNLDFVDNMPRAYIQTDKAMYKHAETIQFRVIFIDQYLLPAKVTQPISVLIKDADDNSIQRFNNIELNTGVFKGKLKLAEAVVSGMWSLEAFVGQDKVAEKYVEIKDYVLPLFEVELDAPSHASLNEVSFPVTVRARYTFGEIIYGNCLFNISRKGQPLIEREYPLIDGQKKMLVHLDDIGRKMQKIYINVTIQDTVTSTTRTISKSVLIVDKRYLIETPSMTNICEDAKDTFSYRAHISHYDGHSVDVDEEVQIQLDKGLNGSPTKIVTYADYNGYVEMEIECSNYKNINITVEYMGETSTGTVKLVSGQPGVYVKTNYPQVATPMEIRVVSSEKFSSFIYVIVGRGNIVYNSIITIPNGASSRSHTFSIEPTYEMMPKAHILVYFFKNGKMFYYETAFLVQKEFQNKISIDTLETTKPGTFISVAVETDPNSYVGLLGMDKSTLLLRSGNDFDAEMIFNGLENVVSKTPEKYLPPNKSYPGEIAGLVTMTNANYDTELKQEESDIRVRASKSRKVRRNFFQTFAFDDFMSVDGQDTLLEKVPDTITSWVITGFSINHKTGLTLTKTPTVFRTFLEFFVSVNLPYSVKIGETITLPVVVFNYLRTDIRASVSMESEKNEFEFVPKSSSTKYTLTTPVRKEKSKTVYFAIRPKVAGMITLRISAESSFGSDEIVKQLRVEYEGITEFNNMDFYINGQESKTIKLDIPPNSVPGSEYIEISVMNFIMGSMLNLINSDENFDKLIRSPIGCGEQNMMHSVPNLLVLKYLQSTDTSNDVLYKKAKSYLQIGYQRELTYKIWDGSFSTWGDAPGITWLTAYVTRIFHEAKSYIFVDDKVLKQGLDFMARKQEADGSFREDGSLTDFANPNKLSVTASVLHAFLENTQYLDKYKTIVDRGLAYMKQHVKETNNMRSIALCLYVLQLRQDPMVNELLTTLETKAMTSGEHKWWQYSDEPENMDVYVTGYILLTLLELKKPVTPIVKWLVSKRNSNGGFSSTLVTEVGLRALSLYAANYKKQSNNMQIDVHSKGQLLKTFKVDEKSTDTNKKTELPKHIRELQFTATGSGKATLQINYRFNSLTPENTIFTVNSSLSNPSAIRKTLKICASLNPSHIQRTGMAVMEVSLPSGEQVGPNCCDLSNSKQAQNVQTSRSNQKLDIYYKGFSKDAGDCLEIETVNMFNITNQKPGSIIIYDYYNKESIDKYYYKIEP
ncbi:thioester-containing protein 1 allele S3-like [Anastrepha ludens]|uniref:thioester-containing protein 1 allele S3-like n=1 Tax=Anastrepha ludens TaxID=28586 RepID=UPI0023AFDEE0|nr:thioester-containing protein 1 allele S3-like [Anastrepha ludens]